MNRAIITAVLVASMIGFYVAYLGSVSDAARQELALSLSLRAGGGAIALVAAAGVLGLWLSGAGAPRLLPGLVVLLAGLALSGAAWTSTLVLAAVAVALILRPGRTRPPPASVDTRPPAA